MPYSPHRTTRRRYLTAAAAIVALVGLVSCSSGSNGPKASGDPTTTSGSSSQWEGKIPALTYNIAGLPEALSGSNPENNTIQIAPKLDAFDLVLLQETWKTPDPNPLAPTRVYYEIIDAHTNHRYKTPMATLPLGKDPQRPSALIADGLGLLSNFPLGKVTRVRWDGCFGGADTSDRGAADCLALKGFALTTITVAPRLTIDVYNLHGEAGSNPKDQELQANDYRQLATYIAEHSKGHAIILGGDTNLHIEDSPENPQDVADAGIWATFLKDTGLADSCPRASCDDTPRIDKFAYRSGGGVHLGVVNRAVQVKRFTGKDGKQLSDHEALSVTFGWRRAN